MLSVRTLLIAALLMLAALPARGAQDAVKVDGWVVIPVDEYRALRTRAYPHDPPPDPPPVPSALTRIAYDLTLADGAATGTATLVVDVLQDGWVEITIPAGLLVRDARVDGRPVPLVDKPRPHVLLSRSGRSVLTLAVVLPVTASRGAESVAIPPAHAAIVQAALQVPRGDVDLSVTNGFLSDARIENGQSRWTAHGRSNEALTLTWRRRMDERRIEAPLRVRGAVTQLVGLGEESTQITAAVRLEIVQGAARAAIVSLPSQMSVTQVAGPLVADWEVTSGGVLRVSFLEPVSQTAAFTVSGELRAAGGDATSVSVPLLRLPEAERETGGIAVEVLGAGEILERQARGLAPADASDLGDVVAGRESPSLVAFRYGALAGTAPRALTVQVSRYATQAALVANVDEARYHALVTEDGKMLVRARYAVRNNRRSLLTAALPAGATLWSASVAGRVVKPGRSPAGALLVPLQKEGTPDDVPPFVVELVYVERVARWTKKGVAQLTMPAIDLPISRTGVVLHHSPRFRVEPSAGAFRAAPYSDPFSPALRPASAGTRLAAACGGAGRAARADEASAAVQELVDTFQREGAPRAAGVLPIEIPFPGVGPAVFLVSELTPETEAATVGLEYERQDEN